MKSILVATDFSDRSDRAFARAADLARAHNAALHLLHVIDGDVPGRLVESQRRAVEPHLDTLAQSARDDGIDTETRVEAGEAHAVIAQAARDTGSDLIVVGSHRRDAVRNAFVGTTAERMIRAGSTPVLVVRTQTPQAYQRVMVAVDPGETGNDHIDRVQILALAPNDALTPIYAYDAGEFHAMRRAGTSAADLLDTFEKEITALQPAIEAQIQANGLTPDQCLIKPALYNTPDTILKASEEAGADLLVVGTRRRESVKRYTLGSVSEACLLRAKTDLLVLPPRD